MFKYGIDHLTSGKAIQIATGDLQAGITQEAKKKIDNVNNNVIDIANGEAIVYGINTGFGPLCNTLIPKEDTSKLQKNLLLSHSVGLGDPIDAIIAKLMMIIKVHSLSQGFSGISMDVLERIMWHIDNDYIPLVPEQGSVGASGDLAPLSHLFLPLIGEGGIFVKGKSIPTSELFLKTGMKAITLEPKSVLALINGTQFISAHAVMVVDRLHNCLEHADLIAALMIEGLQGSQMPFHPELHKTRPYIGNTHVAHRIHHFLQGSEIMSSHKNCDKVQDPYSLRCVPQVHGSSRAAWLHLKEAVEIEINSVTDNPVIFSKDLTISGGNFHGQPLALPLDYACLAAAELGNISDRRSYLALEGKTEGVPKLLLQKTGLNSGFMIVQYTGAAIVSENKTLCFPASADSIPTSLGQEDHVSMGSIGGRKTFRVVKNLEKILGVELLSAAQALDFHRPKKSSKILDAVHGEIRESISFATEDRLFANDINKAINIIKDRSLLSITHNFCDQHPSPNQNKFQV